MRRLQIAFVIGLIVAALLMGLWMTRDPLDIAAIEQLVSTLRNPDRTSTATPAILSASLDAPVPPNSENIDDEAQAESASATTCRSTLVNWLELRDDADSLVAAAVLSLGGDVTAQTEPRKHRARALLRQAIALSPADASIRWLAISVCDERHSCDSSEDERALRSIDPKNAVGWSGEVSRAAMRESKDLDTALRAMARAERFDLYWAENIARVTRAVESAQIAPPPEVKQCPTTLTTSVSAITSLSLPPFASLVAGCRLPDAAHRVAECRAIGAALRKGDTILVHAVGINLSRNVAAPGSSEERELNEDRRRLDWQREQLEKFGERFEIDWLRLQRDKRTESEMMQALLRESGVPLEPPPEWLPNANR